MGQEFGENKNPGKKASHSELFFLERICQYWRTSCEAINFGNGGKDAEVKAGSLPGVSTVNWASKDPCPPSGNTVEVNLFSHGLEVDFPSFEGPEKLKS